MSYTSRVQHKTLKPQVWLGFIFFCLFINVGFANRNDSIKSKAVLLFKPSSTFEMRMPSILFKKNCAIIIDSVRSYDNSYTKSSDDINGFYKTLVDNPTIIIEISAHCSSDEKNVDVLSQKRADLIKELLIKKGISSERMVAKGYGIKKLKISDEQIAKAKTKEEKEALHRLNRRAVVKILNWDYQPKGK